MKKTSNYYFVCAPSVLNIREVFLLQTDSSDECKRNLAKLKKFAEKRDDIWLVPVSHSSSNIVLSLCRFHDDPYYRRGFSKVAHHYVPLIPYAKILMERYATQYETVNYVPQHIRNGEGIYKHDYVDYEHYGSLSARKRRGIAA